MVPLDVSPANRVGDIARAIQRENPELSVASITLKKGGVILDFLVTAAAASLRDDDTLEVTCAYGGSLGAHRARRWALRCAPRLVRVASLLVRACSSACDARHTAPTRVHV